MPFTVVCVFPSQQTKLDMAPRGRRGRSLTELRVTEVNVLQVRANLDPRVLLLTEREKSSGEP